MIFIEFLQLHQNNDDLMVQYKPSIYEKNVKNIIYIKYNIIAYWKTDRIWI